jgi:hypothetical protein
MPRTATISSEAKTAAANSSIMVMPHLSRPLHVRWGIALTKFIE